MIKYISKGDIFASDAEVYVNPVNLFGVMGAGLALEFKNEFPKMFKEYKALSDKGETKFGNLHVYEVSEEENPDYEGLVIINFPTKSSWKNPSQLEYIKVGMEALINIIKEDGYQSVALPALGCGLGGLNWADVKKIIEEYCNQLPEVEFEVYEPLIKAHR